MTNYIGLIIAILLLILQNRYYLSLCKYLAQHYPNEWQKLTQNSLDGTAHANLAESFKNGFFATIDDSKVTRFQTFKRINLLIIAAISAASLATAFLF
ncbi:hypothetical protein [Pseudoalteromonas nigrifaciens]|uniref:hypothetical protein n=1 Tax=Pseudoalteromonas nigrifaciens TaxID=28109 RepID=UPI003CFFD7B0|tara:strand:- start:698 stop:991 length:294 start_codon:yes stop_codon:yes gene_type:complete